MTLLEINKKLQSISNSGDQIELVKNNNVYLIRKTTNHNQKRFLRSLDKQRKFSSLKDFDKHFSTPKIKTTLNIEDKIQVDMEFVDGINFIDHINYSNLDILEKNAKSISSYFSLIFQNSKIERIKSSVLIDKFNEVLIGINRNKKFKTYVKEINNLHPLKILKKDYIDIPVGFCHGDFNFSNMLFQKNNKICLIDFLDVFISSPLIDLAKIHQDIDYFWTSRKLQDIEHLRFVSVMSLFKEMLNLETYKNDYGHLYELFDLINILRIGPYSRDPLTDKWFIKSLGRFIS